MKPVPSDSHNPLPVSDDARDVVWELEAEVKRLREALTEAVATQFQGPRGYAAWTVAREALEAGER